MQNNPKIYNLSQEHELLSAYDFHKNKLQKIYSNKTINQEKPFLMSPHNAILNKIKRNWCFEVGLENNCLVKKMKEIQKQKQDKNQIKIQIKTLNIDKRIKDIQKIMEENQFLEKRLKTINPTINRKKIQSSFLENKKHAENISKFSRRTINCFLINKSKSKNLNSTSTLSTKVYKAPEIKIQTVEFKFRNDEIRNEEIKNKEKDEIKNSENDETKKKTDDEIQENF